MTRWSSSNPIPAAFAVDDGRYDVPASPSSTGAAARRHSEGPAAEATFEQRRGDRRASAGQPSRVAGLMPALAITNNRLRYRRSIVSRSMRAAELSARTKGNLNSGAPARGAAHPDRIPSRILLALVDVRYSRVTMSVKGSSNLDVQPPIAPMLAKLGLEIPVGDYLYEPKWDGFRAIVFRSADDYISRAATRDHSTAIFRSCTTHCWSVCRRTPWWTGRS